MARTIKLRMKRPAKSQSSQYTSPTLEWARVVAIPLTGAFVAAGVAFLSADLTSDRASDATYVQLAITTLSRELPETSASSQARSAEVALRQWATEVLSRTGPVPLPDEAAAALIGGEISIASVAQERANDLAERCAQERTGSSGGLPGEGPAALEVCELANIAAQDAYYERLAQAAEEERAREEARQIGP